MAVAYKSRLGSAKSHPVCEAGGDLTIKGAERRMPDLRFSGQFLSFGDPVRTAVQCPQCWSLERHRLLALAVQSGQISFEGKDVLAFAATLRQLVLRGRAPLFDEQLPGRERRRSLVQHRRDQQPDNSYDAVVCSHVLEHVNDKKALAELFRILRPGGHLIFMVPLIEGWTGTYEDPSIRSDRDTFTSVNSTMSDTTEQTYVSEQLLLVSS